MEPLQVLKQVESTLSLVGDHISVLSSKLEDLLFRAQRIAHALKERLQVTDTMFGYDLQNFRRDVRSFGNELGGLSTGLSGIERGVKFEAEAVMRAQAVMRLCDRVHKSLASLHDQSLLAHQHIRSAEHKVEAWYLVQEIEVLVQQTQCLPTLANKVVIAVSTPAPGAGAPAAAAPPAARLSPQAQPPVPAAQPPAPGPAVPSQPAAPAPAPGPLSPPLKPRPVVPLRPVGRPNVAPPQISPPSGQPGPQQKP